MRHPYTKLIVISTNYIHHNSVRYPSRYIAYLHDYNDILSYVY